MARDERQRVGETATHWLEGIGELKDRVTNLAPPRIQGNPLREKIAQDRAEALNTMIKIDDRIMTSRYFKGGGFVVIVSVDLTHLGPLLHASISHRARFPTWNEIGDIRYWAWGEEEDAMMVFPRTSDYVNVHKNCFHLWSTPTSWLIQ